MASASGSPDWIKFFSAAGIPSRYAAKYAVIFNDHRIQEDMLKDLNKEILYDMGIKTMGDVIAIMRHAKDVDEEKSRDRILSSRPVPPAANGPAKKLVKRTVAVEEKAEATASISNSMARRLGPTTAAASAGISVRKVEVVPVRDQVIKRVIPDAAVPERIIRLQPAAVSGGSVFDRLGGTAVSTLTSGSALRGLSLTASSMPASAKATATVRPTRGTPYSVKNRLGGKAPGREVVSSNLKLKSDPPAASRAVQIVSLKRSIFDRLGS